MAYPSGPRGPNGFLTRISHPRYAAFIAASSSTAFGHSSAQLYKSSNGRDYALAFKGTDINADDLYTDVAQGAFGQILPTEYDHATKLARLVSAAVGHAPLTMVGHSLGGGLADAAAYAADRPAVTFNAAGLNLETKWHNNAYGGSFDRTLANYTIAGQFLAEAQDNIALVSNVPGANFILQPAAVDKNDGPLQLHSIAAVLRALGE